MRVAKQQVPWTMAAARAALGPLMALGAHCGWNGLTMAAIVLFALLSDIFDGVLARRWRCDTAAVRLFDSMADTVFYLGVACALWIAHRDTLRAHALLFAPLLALEATRFAFDFAKFGRPASYHSWLAKTWGLVLAAAVVTVFALGNTSGSSGMVTLALALGVVCNLEGLAMSVVLPAWTRDVKTLASALRIRRAPPGAARRWRPQRLQAARDEA